MISRSSQSSKSKKRASAPKRISKHEAKRSSAPTGYTSPEAAGSSCVNDASAIRNIIEPSAHSISTLLDDNSLMCPDVRNKIPSVSEASKSGETSLFHLINNSSAWDRDRFIYEAVAQIFGKQEADHLAAGFQWETRSK